MVEQSQALASGTKVICAYRSSMIMHQEREWNLWTGTVW